MPERFNAYPNLASHYTSDGLGRDYFSYGAGRRVCPGIHLAERNLFRRHGEAAVGVRFPKADE